MYFPFTPRVVIEDKCQEPCAQSDTTQFLCCQHAKCLFCLSVCLLFSKVNTLFCSCWSNCLYWAWNIAAGNTRSWNIDTRPHYANYMFWTLINSSNDSLNYRNNQQAGAVSDVSYAWLSIKTALQVWHMKDETSTFIRIALPLIALSQGQYRQLQQFITFDMVSFTKQQWSWSHT